jgi:hypothetical protein
VSPCSEDSGRGARWTEDDDRYILANMKSPARELVLALGRTSYSVYVRRWKLRRRSETPAGQATRPLLAWNCSPLADEYRWNA